MPLLTKEERIAKLRTQFPKLTHTSGEKLEQIVPHRNEDQHHEWVGDAVFATSSDSDFYALRCNKGRINYSIPYFDSDGKVNQIFIFDKMKDTYYEYVVSSENFIPIVSGEEEVFHGEWISRRKIKPESVKVGNKEDVLKRTPAKVFTISKFKEFKANFNEETFAERIRNPGTALEAIQELVRMRILKKANNPDGLRKRLSKLCRGWQKHSAGR